MMTLMKRFSRGEDGAVTVDWVVLTAGVIVLIGVAFGAVRNSTGDLAGSVGSYMASK